MSKLFDNLLKAAGVGVILYGVYKLGEKNALSSMEQEITPNKFTSKIDEEINGINTMIQELKSKSCKTKKDRDNIDLLEVKIKQLKNRK
jgi:hypothetical protein